MTILAKNLKTGSSTMFSVDCIRLTRSIIPTSEPSLFPKLPLAQACSRPLLGWYLLENLHTLYLFTKSDFKTVLLPVTVFASVMAPLTHIKCLPPVTFWIWLHLLQFCVSNQCVNPEEDAVNKPWRPIPAGRVTISQAQNLRRVLVASCLLLSMYRGILPASILICLSTVIYNDLGFHGHLLMRNVCNAVGYASFELGATQLAAGNSSVDSPTVAALIASSLIVFTTIHAADFRDERGDRLEGKNTFPISFPEASRVVMLASLVLWSSVLVYFWNIDFLLGLVLLVMGAMIGFRFVYRRDAAADRRSYLLYNIWLSLAHICMGIGHHHSRAIISLRHPMMTFL